MNVAEILARPYSQELLSSPIPARLAYTALDGTPRVIPIGYHWNGAELEMFTVPRAAKVKALEANPTVAVTIDTDTFPPKVLLVRGTVRLELVDGVPDAYLLASTKAIPDEEGRAQFATEVRSLYEQMVAITLTPEWAKLLDFESTIPSAVEDLVRERAARGG